MLALANVESSNVLFNTYTDETLVLSLYLSGKTDNIYDHNCDPQLQYTDSTVHILEFLYLL